MSPSPKQKPSKPISKSTYLSLLQCPKLFWTIFNVPDQIPAQEINQSRFDEGKLVEKYARQLFPQGIPIDHSQSFAQTIAQSQSALSSAPFNTPIFNALITAPGLVCEIDILIPPARNQLMQHQLYKKVTR